MNIPPQYSSKRAGLEVHEISYGVGGVELYKLHDLESSQLGYSVDAKGRSLVGDGSGDWRSDWIVIDRETACGDPIFLSSNPPHPVFTTVHGQGTWTAELIAPTLEQFWDCLDVFRHFALHRDCPIAVEANPPGGQETRAYMREVLRLCDGNTDTATFWAVQAEIGMDAGDP